MTVQQQLAAGLTALGLGLDAATQARLLQYLELLSKWNAVYSLTAIREPEKMVSHHLLDCLAVLPLLLGPQVLDVGSGGGMPGIPLAIVHPEISVTLLDSNHKKTAFLQQAVIDLGLSNVRVVTERVELFQGGPFTTITSRAFSELAEFVKLSGHLLASDGEWAAMKGIYPFEETARLPADIEVKEILPISVPGLDAERHLVRMQRRG